MTTDDKYLKYKVCVVCNVPQSEAPGVIYAKFPKNINRCRKWIRVIGNVKLLQLSLKKIQYRYVCGNHFASSFFTKSGKHLTKDAIPTILPPNVRPLKREVVKLFPPLITTTSEKVLLKCTQRIVPINRDVETSQPTEQEYLKEEYLVQPTEQEYLKEEYLVQPTEQEYLKEEYLVPFKEEYLDLKESLEEVPRPKIKIKQKMLDDRIKDCLPNIIPILHHNLTPNSQATEIYTITKDRQVVPITRKVFTDGKDCIIELSQNRLSKRQTIIPVKNEVLSTILKKNMNIKLESIDNCQHSQPTQTPSKHKDGSKEELLQRKIEKLKRRNRQLKKILKNISIVDEVASPNIQRVVEKAIKSRQLVVGVNEFTNQREVAISVLKRALMAYRYLNCLLPLPNVCALQNISMKDPVYSNTTKCRHLL